MRTTFGKQEFERFKALRNRENITPSTKQTSVDVVNRFDAAHTPSDSEANPHTTAGSPIKRNASIATQTASAWFERLQHTVKECIVIDIETTGLEPRTDRIIEIAAIHIRDGQPVQRFHSLVNPQQAIPSFITDLTGISDGLLADAPPFSTVAESLYSFLTTAQEDSQGTVLPLVGHNVSFDFSFLQHEFVRHTLSDGGKSPFTPYTPQLLCTAEASRALIDRQVVGRYRLEKVAAALNTEHRPHHRAESDAQATIDVLVALANLEL